ncbi:MAG: helix-turn-helix domain-containing protein [Candidatus Dojkabacteria bacterium]|nr:helix-turn-helix domain-containing protein [Candidatus Dojkabacteria bacterium]
MTLKRDLLDGEVDTNLFDRLRVIRKKIADREDVPPYLIFQDSSLKEMAQYFPQKRIEFKRIKGVGQKKFDDYGKDFIKEIKLYCEENDVRSVPIPIKQKRTRGISRSATIDETASLFYKGLSPEEIVENRGIKVFTVISHLEKAYLGGEDIDIFKLVPKDKQKKILDACKKIGKQKLAPIKEFLGDNYSYNEIRLMRASLLRKD